MVDILRDMDVNVEEFTLKMRELVVWVAGVVGCSTGALNDGSSVKYVAALQCTCTLDWHSSFAALVSSIFTKS
jgi:hypothetical protein